MSQIKVILRQDVTSLGDAGEVVAVTPGYAFNFLLPQGKAILASEAKLKALEHYKRVVAEQVARERKGIEAERDRLQQVVLEIPAQAGEEGRLFGSVTAIQIAELLAARGHAVDRRKMLLDEPIKELGEHEVGIRLHRDVVAKLKVKVIAAE
jgi:large subunit ribosomal protein L9